MLKYNHSRSTLLFNFYISYTMWNLALLFIFVPQVWCVTECPQFWVPLAGSCYALLHDKLAWASADDFCKDLGGYLAEITSREEETAITHYMEVKNPTIKSVWLGGSDILHDGTWFWVTSKDPLTITFWAPGQPDNYHSENCIHLNRYQSGHWFWNDLDCQTKMYGLCETDLNGPAFG